MTPPGRRPRSRSAGRQTSARLRLGTSSWSSREWVGPFYPPGTSPEKFIEHYATVYDTVEVDSTYYAMPAAATVKAWRSHTPDGFTFAVKTPGLITHEKALVDAADDMRQFLDIVGGLGPKLGPVLLQFPYFNKQAFSSPTEFLDRLDGFAGTLPRDVRFAVEVRNRAWVKPPLVDLCRRHRLALAWVDQAWMPPAEEWPELTGGPTTEFAYVRWLGDRKKIEAITKTFDRTVIDRRPQLVKWVAVVRELVDSGRETFAYFNNHYAGYAPESARLFLEMFRGG